MLNLWSWSEWVSCSWVASSPKLSLPFQQYCSRTETTKASAYQNTLPVYTIIVRCHRTYKKFDVWVTWRHQPSHELRSVISKSVAVERQTRHFVIRLNSTNKIANEIPMQQVVDRKLFFLTTSALVKHNISRASSTRFWTLTSWPLRNALLMHCTGSTPSFLQDFK